MSANLMYLNYQVSNEERASRCRDLLYEIFPESEQTRTVRLKEYSQRQIIRQKKTPSITSHEEIKSAWRIYLKDGVPDEGGLYESDVLNGPGIEIQNQSVKSAWYLKGSPLLHMESADVVQQIKSAVSHWEAPSCTQSVCEKYRMRVILEIDDAGKYYELLAAGMEFNGMWYAATITPLYGETGAKAELRFELYVSDSNPQVVYPGLYLAGVSIKEGKMVSLFPQLFQEFPGALRIIANPVLPEEKRNIMLRLYRDKESRIWKWERS